MCEATKSEAAREALITIHDKLVVELASYEEELVQKLKDNNLLKQYQATLLSKETSQATVLSTKKYQVRKIDYILKYCVQFQLKNDNDGPFQVLMKLMRDCSSDNKTLLSFAEYIEEKMEASEYSVEQETATSHQQTAANLQHYMQNPSLSMSPQEAGGSRSSNSNFNHPVKISARQQVTKNNNPIEHVTDEMTPIQSTKKQFNQCQKVTDTSAIQQEKHHFSVNQNPSKLASENVIPAQRVIKSANPIQEAADNSSAIQDATFFKPTKQVIEDSNLVKLQNEHPSTNQSTANQYSPSQFVSTPVEQNTPHHFSQPTDSVSPRQLNFGQQVTSPNQDSMTTFSETDHSTNTVSGKLYNVQYCIFLSL